MKAGLKLDTAQTTIYTVPQNATEALVFNIVNTDTTNTVSVTLLVSDDGTTWHEIFLADLQPKSTVQITNIVLNAGDQIAGFASIAGVVSVVITGVRR